MTGIEVENLGRTRDDRWEGSFLSRLLVPVVTAIIVLALGLILVGLTAGGAERAPLDPPAAEAGLDS